MSIPTPWTVGHKVWSESGRDAHGNAVDVWADPVDVPVHGVAPLVREGREPDSGNRSLVVEGLQLFAPAGTRIDAMDRVVWRGEEFEVDGEVGDYTSGPWRNPVAGVVINLKRAEG